MNLLKFLLLFSNIKNYILENKDNNIFNHNITLEIKEEILELLINGYQ